MRYNKVIVIVVKQMEYGIFWFGLASDSGMSILFSRFSGIWSFIVRIKYQTFTPVRIITTEKYLDYLNGNLDWFKNYRKVRYGDSAELRCASLLRIF